MTIDAAHFQKLLNDFKLEQLFNELGWDHASLNPQEIAVNGEAFTLTAVAQKRGVAVLRCSPDSGGSIPPRPTLLKIEKEALKLAHEHLLVFADAKLTTLTWLWVSRAPGQPTATRTHTWHQGTNGESLRQKLNQIVWALEEEEAITLTDVITGLRRAFDRDKVSKSFYEKFKAEHGAFAEFIAGLTGTADKAWYASLMLNRLMFVYFIQRKGFLDGNIDYLADRMQRVKSEAGEGHFHSFYRQFLRRLFHEGLGQAKNERDSDLARLIGEVPYLNGGLFDEHELEEANPDIDIPDEAFERLFRFFDAYDWHLDDRPLSKGSEINPDVLGYIFEKYINQKQMGAYYTKEDITEYISKNTVVPHLIEKARERCKVAFDGEASVWHLLKADPDRYLYPAMKIGVIDASGKRVPEIALPDFVQAGMKDPKARMFERRYNLGEATFHTATGERGTLPTETWREYVERRTRCLALRTKLANGEVKSADDLITLNLDIRQFMQDVIDTCTSTDLLRAVWQAIVGRVPERANEKFRHGITVLDPTCGSGAFLFAALNVLEPLYEACLDRMEDFIEDARKLGKSIDTEFVKVLGEVGHHHSRRYFIYKSIILHNLFGVDIMPEAVEICKLRLFLKLVSQVDGGRELEPLPDIDFNIRAGNTLVGYATEAQFDAANTLASDQSHRAEIKASTADLADSFDFFRQQQTAHDGKVTAADKRKLRDKLDGLSLELDRYLAQDYGIDSDNATAFAAWRNSHQPFHWFAEFYGVMREGGFDVVIGNPPWVEFTKVSGAYKPRGLKTISCNNLWAFVVERSYQVLNPKGLLGLIVPMSLVCTERMKAIQDLASNVGKSWVSNYESDSNPGQLFDGVKQNVSILVTRPSAHKEMQTTRLVRFFQPFRSYVFETLHFCSPGKFERIQFGIPKIGSEDERQLLAKLFSRPPLRNEMVRHSKNSLLVHRIAHYYIKCFDFVPYFRSDRDGEKKSEDYKPYAFRETTGRYVAAINSTAFYFYWQVFFDGFKAGKVCVESFPFGGVDSTPCYAQLEQKSISLMVDMQNNATRLQARYASSGNVEYDQFSPRKSKDLIDEIDQILARHYGLADAELDLVINYDVKFRSSESDDEE